MPISTEQSNTSVVIGNQARAQGHPAGRGGHQPRRRGRPIPDRAHVVRPLARRSAVRWSIERARATTSPRRSRVVQQFIPNEGDGWNYVLDALDRVLEEVITRPDVEEVMFSMPARASRRRRRRAGAGQPACRPASAVGGDPRSADRRDAPRARLGRAPTRPSRRSRSPRSIDERCITAPAACFVARSVRCARCRARPPASSELLDREDEVLERLEVVMHAPITADEDPLSRRLPPRSGAVDR